VEEAAVNLQNSGQKFDMREGRFWCRNLRERNLGRWKSNIKIDIQEIESGGLGLD
jgi:hypothetical protein